MDSELLHDLSTVYSRLSPEKQSIAFVWAAYRGKKDVVQMFIDRGVDVNTVVDMPYPHQSRGFELKRLEGHLRDGRRGGHLYGHNRDHSWLEWIDVPYEFPFPRHQDLDDDSRKWVTLVCRDFTALQAAAWGSHGSGQHAEIVELLLDSGADPDSKSLSQEIRIPSPKSDPTVGRFQDEMNAIAREVQGGTCITQGGHKYNYCGLTKAGIESWLRRENQPEATVTKTIDTVTFEIPPPPRETTEEALILWKTEVCSWFTLSIKIGGPRMSLGIILMENFKI